MSNFWPEFDEVIARAPSTARKRARGEFEQWIERFLLACAAALIVSASLFAQPAPDAVTSEATTPTQAAGAVDPAANTPALRATYQLGPDDEIVIHSNDIPEINGKPMRLDPDGDLRLPMIGTVHAAGMTLEQLEAEVTTRLKVYIQEPDVAIAVTQFFSHSVTVIGAVGASGVRRLEGTKTLIEMLSLAGGVTAEAGPTVRVTRRLEKGRIPLPTATDDPTGGFSIAEVDLKSLLAAQSPETNILIKPNDVISVPRAEMVYVIGEVTSPGRVPVTAGQSVSVLEAVSASGGVTRTASTKHTRILRRTQNAQQRTEVRVDLKKIMRGQADDIPLMAGDILVVPDSGGKRAMTRALAAALQVGIMVGSYGIAR